jgi:hypothetical protein
MASEVIEGEMDFSLNLFADNWGFILKIIIIIYIGVPVLVIIVTVGYIVRHWVAFWSWIGYSRPLALGTALPSLFQP